MVSLNSPNVNRTQCAVRWSVLSIAMLLTSGCSMFGGQDKGFSFKNLGFNSAKERQSEQEPAYDKIAANLVNSLAQVPRLNPDTTAVQVSDSTHAFDEALKDALASEGFEMNYSRHNADALRVTSDVQKMTSVTGLAHQIFHVDIGDVSVSRGYAAVDGSTVPVTSQMFKGTEAHDIKTNDELFGQPDQSLATIEFLKPNSEGKERIKSVSSEPTEPRLLAANASDARRQNYFESGRSNYEGVFRQYEAVDSSVLIFPNDSLRLGGTNKAIIEQYVAKMNPETDVLSVVGCSLGPTSINNGNSLLAIGRANRVKEAFLFSGIEHDQVLEEGCWAPGRAGMELPTRGVVVTLKRQKKS